MSRKFTILIVDDDESTRKLLHSVLTIEGYECQMAENLERAEAVLRQGRIDLALVDLYLGTANGLNVLDLVKVIQPRCKCVIMTAHATVETVARSLSEGALEYLSKPLLIDELLTLVRKVQSDGQSPVKEVAKEEASPETAIIGRSESMLEVYRAIARVAATNASVLITGASGTGKELVARAIHAHSARAQGPFVPVNCGAFSETLLESELFGHEQGAFTGAHQRKKGKLELAHGGTVFFDEIGDISQELQAKLLRFLQEREFERVGGVISISVNVRVIAATNRDLEVALEKGLFREDLYHRLNVVPINLPPLRERKEDIAVLSQFFLRKYSTATRRSVSEISPQTMEQLTAYHWPGNVRELANVIERAVVLGSEPTVNLADLPNRIAAGAAADTLSYREAVTTARKDVVLKALSRTQGNRSAAAKMLGLDTKYFLKLMKSLEIE